MISHSFKDGCDFCAIARGDDPAADVICEDENWVAFFPLDPATPGHTLIIPRIHVEDLWKTDVRLAADLMAGIVYVGQVIERTVTPNGMNLITSAGSAAEQTVFHLHLHLVPRWRRDGFGRIWPTSSRYSDAALEDVADRIRAACRE